MKALHPTRKPYLAAQLRKLTGAALFAFVVFSTAYTPAAIAQGTGLKDTGTQGTAELDAALLLEQLRSAGPDEAAKLARQIKRNWARSGSASADLLLKRGRDALQSKKPKIAIEHLTALTDHAPEFAEGWHMRASALYQQQLYGPALEDLERVLKLNPKHFDAIQGLGAIFEQLGDPVRAYEVYEQVLTIHPHHATVLEAMERLEIKVKGPAL